MRYLADSTQTGKNKERTNKHVECCSGRAVGSYLVIKWLLRFSSFYQPSYCQARGAISDTTRTNWIIDNDEIVATIANTGRDPPHVVVAVAGWAAAPSFISYGEEKRRRG